MTATTNVSNNDYSWLSGNARLIDLSGQLLGAHIAHAGLIIVLVRVPLRLTPNGALRHIRAIVSLRETGTRSVRPALRSNFEATASVGRTASGRGL